MLLNHIYIYFSVLSIYYKLYYNISVSEINLTVFRIYIVIHNEITFTIKQKIKKYLVKENQKILVEK